MGLAGRFPVTDLSREDGGEEDRRDFLDTAAVMSQLDLVVTPETAVAHLAGSLGVPVWVALSAVGDWRWMIDRDDSPWYPRHAALPSNHARRLGRCLPADGRHAETRACEP